VVHISRSMAGQRSRRGVGYFRTSALTPNIRPSEHAQLLTGERFRSMGRSRRRSRLSTYVSAQPWGI